MGAKILVVYPHNFMLHNSGINVRTYELLKYLTHRGFGIDLISLSGFVDEWPQERQIKTDDIEVKNINLFDFNRRPTLISLDAFVRSTWQKILPNSRFSLHSKLPNYAFPEMKHLFNTLVNAQHYDFILISYAYWAGLVEGNSYPKTTLILEISDNLTLNLWDAFQGNINFCSVLKEEIRRINFFDKIFCISTEELRFFSRLATKPIYHHIPHFLPEPTFLKKPHLADACFVASDNPHNIRGLNWFCDHILPKLPTDFRCLIVGKINKHLPRKMDQIISIPYLENLSDIYSACDIAICPLLGGTGMKIKVVEALAYGLPVVCTSHGLVGFEDKRLTGCNVANNPTEFAALIQKLIDDRDFYTEQSALAKAYFRDCFEQTRVEKSLDSLFS